MPCTLVTLLGLTCYLLALPLVQKSLTDLPNLTLLAGFVLASIELATNLLNPLVQYSSLILGFWYLALGIV
jgi:hypothetical protein